VSQSITNFWVYYLGIAFVIVRSEFFPAVRFVTILFFWAFVPCRLVDGCLGFVVTYCESTRRLSPEKQQRQHWSVPNAFFSVFRWWWIYVEEKCNYQRTVCVAVYYSSIKRLDFSRTANTNIFFFCLFVCSPSMCPGHSERLNLFILPVTSHDVWFWETEGMGRTR
jgi:hypothetical protein